MNKKFEIAVIVSVLTILLLGCTYTTVGPVNGSGHEEVEIIEYPQNDVGIADSIGNYVMMENSANERFEEGCKEINDVEDVCFHTMLDSEYENGMTGLEVSVVEVSNKFKEYTEMFDETSLPVSGNVRKIMNPQLNTYNLYWKSNDNIIILIGEYELEQDAAVGENTRYSKNTDINNDVVQYFLNRYPAVS